QEGEIWKGIVSYTLVLACQERLDYWHYLQDLGGVKNYHALVLAEKLRKEWEEEKQKEIEKLREEYEQKIKDTAKDAASQAMEKVAALLLDMETINSLSLSSPTSQRKIDKSDSAGDDQAEKNNEVAEKTPSSDGEASTSTEEEEDILEPWLDSFLCTSCNECINLNPNMFKYNSEKQAYIADPKAGIYAELVKAAENCPAKCIHPGKPLDPNEPNLAELMERAAKFN
ncbi:MAG: ferredoxin, partial [Planctomycetota bacterium]